MDCPGGWQLLTGLNTAGLRGLRQKKETGKEKAKLFLTRRIKSEMLLMIFEVGYVTGFLRSRPRDNSYAVSLS